MCLLLPFIPPFSRSPRLRIIDTFVQNIFIDTRTGRLYHSFCSCYLKLGNQSIPISNVHHHGGHPGVRAQLVIEAPDGQDVLRLLLLLDDLSPLQSVVKCHDASFPHQPQAQFIVRVISGLIQQRNVLNR